MESQNRTVHSFSQVLVKVMKDRKVTVSALSRATGIPVSTISEWTANRTPKFSPELIKIAKYFDVTLEYLLTGKAAEEQVIDGLVKSMESEFVQVHQGQYRITVEKKIIKEGD